MIYSTSDGNIITSSKLQSSDSSFVFLISSPIVTKFYNDGSSTIKLLHTFDTFYSFFYLKGSYASYTIDISG